ncbi:cytochrome P450 [Mycobacterium sp. 852002-10029_SCH5224772]|uniref:cytochrome P450 n=1 Tax=Mycobacterium sp. 852002-10029_SCH5224772 TaxID=1834083 RepID=UPI0007FFA3DC|nr:cytochrome P450 [Mycobacterium sp. 852002-10029_SCH5224772]OBF09623.1 cytochrome [Mycobacterium sp. 852002-10029_SCH5224772]
MTTPEIQSAQRLPWDATDPFPYYERRRQEGDVVWDDSLKAWLVLGYHLAGQILGGTGWTSDPLANPNAPAGARSADPDMLRRNMLLTDGVDHVRLRGAVRDVFTRSFISGLEQGVDAIAAQTIDPLTAGADFDFMTEVALPLPIAVAAAWLGLDVDSTRLLRAESPAISAMLGDFNDVDAVEAGTAAVAALLTEFLPLAADRRRHPGDDLLSFISADPNLELDDVVITAIVIAIAGHETTANLLGAAMVRLLAPAPDGVRPIDLIDAVDDGLVTELLRLDGPVQAVTRTATQDHVLDGTTIRAGEPVLVVLAAANRDPAIFREASQFQAGRAGPAPLSFGYGAHYCLGAALARLEIRTALQHILARGAALRGIPIWRDNPAIRGPQSLLCALGTP